MRDEKEERKKQARSNKQTRQSNTAHPPHVHNVIQVYMYTHIHALSILYAMTRSLQTSPMHAQYIHKKTHAARAILGTLTGINNSAQEELQHRHHDECIVHCTEPYVVYNIYDRTNYM